jgi:hypothetical protein
MIRKIYKTIRNALPPALQANLSKFVFEFSGKPFIKKDHIPLEMKFPNQQKGGMIISADFESAWAYRYAKCFVDPHQAALQKALQTRKNVPILINLFEEFNTAITWATVGHLFLKNCKKGDHDWMKRIPYFENRNWKYDNGDWFDCDPYTSVEKDAAWYAPDLIQMILNSKIPHEISTHTFSHIDFSDRHCPREVAEDEIVACLEAMKPYGLVPQSIVFPGGTWGNTRVLKKYGINIYRKNTDFDLSYPYFDELGLLVSPTSLGFGKNHESWNTDYYILRFQTFLDKAIETGTIAHFWFHPSMDDWTLGKVMPPVLRYADEKRKEGLLWIGNMNQISEFILKLHLK